jgi:hypothetical protein
LIRKKKLKEKDDSNFTKKITTSKGQKEYAWMPKGKGGKKRSKGKKTMIPNSTRAP